ncbi:FtsX-like permease family protein [Subsaximicrobium wynnwilliamsii]|uniref:FtsX-like permease family protein n=1 Tax=Subsaximicrobium wynnwilliamsii TaxID=291179 RepID=A0A5C6ZGG4_9FLAO|nr:ABC transporter permease [Subsaximicrobium wynnwilliamsii]TXD83184.1 FtsX-like permease family protein [Subsaximicrobium wynnwilliamsii]TXD88297.1 FtsX-like permease family protein [Subsaximicrobium wynnwilliamsii]TXE03018.1 FtsX-like permease family protein [Subsaximicrobium wynnwilliamsii]
MIRNHFKIALRYLFKNKLYSILNIVGLALGIAAFVIITLYVGYERSYDKFEGSDEVFRVYMDYAEGGNFVPGDAQTYNLSGPTLKKEFPEIIEQVRLYRLEKVTFVNGEKIIQQPNGSLADASYFKIFDHPLIEGNLSDFEKPNTIILTKTLAKKLFGKKQVLGKSLEVFDGNGIRLEIVGIINDIAQNTHYKTNFLISYPTMNTWDMGNNAKPNWSGNNFFTYLKVAPGIDKIALRKKIMMSDFEQDPDERHNIEAISDIHLHSDKPFEAETNGSLSRVRFLSAIGFIILILSWLNYVNLATAKSMERSKEVGIRKVAGAQRSQLIVQSLGESLLLNLFAVALAIGLAYVLLPLFNNFVGKELVLGLSNLGIILPYLAFILLGTLVSGLYPAMVISGFSPIRALKGKVVASRGGVNIRKGLIGVQFFATVVLIIGTLVVSQQISFLGEQPLGVDLSQLVALKGELLSNENDSITRQKSVVLESELSQLPFVKGVTQAKTYPGDGYDNLSSNVGITYPDGTSNERLLFYLYGAQPNYFEVLGIDFLAGKTYLRKNPGVHNFDIVINETFARIMGFTDMSEIIGKNVKFWDETWTVTGVFEDYHHFGLKSKIEPMFIGDINWAFGTGLQNVLVKMDATGLSLSVMDKNLDQIQQKWKTIFPQSTLDYTFLDKKFEAQYKEDTKFGAAFQLFTGLAIFIAGLGLFGLTSYTILQRKKEIGIRKVSGASVLQILTLLNRDFLKLVTISFILAAPIAWYVMNQWLQEFAYQTRLNWWVFALAGIAAFLVAIISVSFQAIKAAIANPVKSLRTE